MPRPRLAADAGAFSYTGRYVARRCSADGTCLA